MGDILDNILNDNSDVSNLLRAMMGSLFIILTFICCVYCLYKYAVCQEKYKYTTGSILVYQNGGEGV